MDTAEPRSQAASSVDWSADEIDAAIGRKQRRRWPWLLLALVVFGAVAIGLTTRGSLPAEDEAVTDVVNTAEVVTADLVEVDTFDGTLGRVSEEPIVSLNPGVLTFVAEAGDVIDNGDVMYRVEGDPVVLLDGPAPPYRDLALASGSSAVMALSLIHISEPTRLLVQSRMP